MCFLDGSSEMEDVLVQQCLTSEETEQRPTTVKRASEVEEQLQLTLEKLRLKEKEVNTRFQRSLSQTLSR